MTRRFMTPHYISLRQLQSWPNKFVLGCVISPLRQQAESRNLGQTFLANSVRQLRVSQVTRVAAVVVGTNNLTAGWQAATS